MPDSSTILLVDDEDAVQKLLAYPLERDGFRVVQARDGEEALARFAEERFDLVVLDLMLPKLDGLEVCKRLRASSSVPIIMLTARDDEVDKVLGLELGADDYITKPFSIREFRSRVRALLRRAAARRPPAPPPPPRAAARRRRRRGDRVGRARDRPRPPHRRGARPPGAADVRRVRAAADARRAAGPRLHAPDAARVALGRVGLPRAADDRRPRAPPAREARARRARAGVHPDRPRRRLPLPRPVNPLSSVGARLSLALIVVVAAALGVVYLGVVPYLERNQIDAKVSQL